MRKSILIACSVFFLSIGCSPVNYTPAHIQTNEEKLVEAAAEAIVLEGSFALANVSEQEQSTVVDVLPEHTAASSEFLDKVSSYLLHKLGDGTDIGPETLKGNLWLQDLFSGDLTSFHRSKMMQSTNFDKSGLRAVIHKTIEGDSNIQNYVQAANRRLDFRRCLSSDMSFVLLSEQDIRGLRQSVEARKNSAQPPLESIQIATHVQEEALRAVSKNLKQIPQIRQRIGDKIGAKSNVRFRVEGILFELIKRSIIQDLLPALNEHVFESLLIDDSEVYRQMLARIRQKAWDAARVAVLRSH